MSEIICPNCNTSVVQGSSFCDYCGFDLRNLGKPAQVPPQAGPGSVGAGPGSAGAAPSPTPAQPGPAGVVCEACGHNNIPGSAFCENCGGKLVAPARPIPQQPSIPPEQPPIPAGPPEPLPVQPPVQPPQQPAYPPPVTTPQIIIQASGTPVLFPAGKLDWIVGREDPVSSVFPDIDLTPHGGQEAGVSRQHAKFILQGDQMMIEDLNSVNGTFVNKQRLSAAQPTPINHGDEIRFGNLVIIYSTGRNL